MENLRIGTMVKGDTAVKTIPQIVAHGFECFSLTFWQSTNGIDLVETSKK